VGVSRLATDVVTTVVIVLATLFAATPLGSSAHAQDATPGDDASAAAEARSLFEQGLERADHEQWGEALEYFRRSRALLERPSTVFNLGNALYRLGRYREAIHAFEDFARIADPADADSRRSATDLLAACRGSLGTLVLRITPGSAYVRIDGQLVEGAGELRELEVDPGEHVVSMSAPGRRESTMRLALLPGTRLERVIGLAVSTDVTGLPGGPARITVTSNVSNAVITLDHHEVGRGTAVEEVEPGSHAIEVAAPDHETFRRTVLVRRGASLEIAAALERSGGGGIFASPAFWIVTSIVIAGAATGTVLALTLGGEEDPNRGSSGVVLMGLHAP